MEEKSQLRKRLLNQRDELDKAKHTQLSANICMQLYELVKDRKAKVVHTYIPMGSEVNIIPLINQLLEDGITVVAPKSLKGRILKNLVLNSLDELESGIYNTQYPAGNNEYKGNIDLVITPGLAFDKQCNRLGYGAGYYDIFLADNPSTLKVGICFPFQLMDELPVNEYDIPMDAVIC